MQSIFGCLVKASNALVIGHVNLLEMAVVACPHLHTGGLSRAVNGYNFALHVDHVLPKLRPG